MYIYIYIISTWVSVGPILIILALRICQKCPKSTENSAHSKVERPRGSCSAGWPDIPKVLLEGNRKPGVQHASLGCHPMQQIHK